VKLLATAACSAAFVGVAGAWYGFDDDGNVSVAPSLAMQNLQVLQEKIDIGKTAVYYCIS
jgi:hypothetical protein